MRAIFINAKEQTISELDIAPGLKPMYEAIGCSLVELVRLTPTADLWIDEEGLINETDYGFWLAGKPLMGNGLILNHDGEGECTASTLDINVIKRTVTFFVVD